MLISAAQNCAATDRLATKKILVHGFILKLIKMHAGSGVVQY
jgi:hypothetical protein